MHVKAGLLILLARAILSTGEASAGEPGTHAADILKRAAGERARGDDDAANVLEWRFLRIARRWPAETKKSWSLDQEEAARRRVCLAYLGLAQQLLDRGELAAVGRVRAMLVDVDPDSPEVVELGAAIEDLARTAYIRAYTMTRDGGAESRSDARKLLRFAAAAIDPESVVGRKIHSLLAEVGR